MIKTFKKKKYRILFAIGLFMIVGFFSIFLINKSIIDKSSQYIFESRIDIPQTYTVMILGARVYQNKYLGGVVENRTLKAIELYNEGIVTKILVSGDNGQDDYDEVNAIKNYLLEKGVKSEDIFLDHAGFDTYDSMYRARDIFDVENLIISTQQFHLPRAVYIARELGIDAYGIVAEDFNYSGNLRNSFREVFARVKAWLNVTFEASPQYLGDVISINGDGQLSWD